jgi:hypothetical protein
LEAGEILIVGALASKLHGGHAASAVSQAATEAAASDALMDHAASASAGALQVESKLAMMSAGVSHFAHKYLVTIETVAKVHLFDEIAHGIVNGEHHESGEQKHAGTRDEHQAAYNFFGKKILEYLGEQAGSYKMPKSVFLSGMRKAGDVAHIAQLAKSKKGTSSKDVAKDVAKGIKQKLEKISMVNLPGEKDQYDFRYVTLIAGKFRRRIRKIVGKVYSSTVMNSPPHGNPKQLWNFGDVVVELEEGFQTRENWSSVRLEVGKIIHEFEKSYPGINFSITSKGNGRNLITTNSVRHHYPDKIKPIFVYNVDSLVSW